ncbi:MAG: FAD-dependent oxidoreductase [Acidobacteriota bacterium]|nr:MAG: FAD-dependent oxidoreductase [Acidobacteriota bacterium]
MGSLEEFHAYRRVLLDKYSPDRPTLILCAGTGGQASGSNDIMRVLKRQILERKLHEKISLRITGCLGFCEMDPFILVEPGGQLYPKLKTDDVPRIIDAALKGEIVEGLLYREPADQKRHDTQDHIPFFRKQTRTILGKNQQLDPIRIRDYIKANGYDALEKVLNNPDPEWIIKEVKLSGLRGRGGAGFPTGTKWELARRSGKEGIQKFIVCNADEGDPGAYMDRSLLEGNPHSIIEGMLIAGIAIGASRGIIYVRSEYPLAIKHALIAILQARKMGILGDGILGTDINFDIEIVQGAGAFVCGEETALMKSIEGKMGEPRQRPPFPIQKGIDGKPTVINNVETLANIPVIISKGGEEYAKVGVPGNTGTKIFSLVGKINNTGLVEVPMGTTLREMVYDIGGGAPGGKKIKAVQTGGPSGGCIPSSMFDLSIDYDSLSKVGSIMGSGGMIVMDEDTCMVDVAKYFMKFLKEESCGKCFTCRKGTQRMYEILDDISTGRGTLEQLDLLKELAEVVKDTTMCALGQTASNPVLSALRYFYNEYEQHIVHKKCPAKVCSELVGVRCQSSCPLGTEVWRYVAHIQRGEYEDAYRVIRRSNPFPSVCARVCHHPCESTCQAGVGGQQPIAIRSLKRFVTDNVDPSVFRPEIKTKKGMPRVAVIGAGPAGITAAHDLSLLGYQVTLFESATELGGMLHLGIPSYRLPREMLQKEIDSLLNENITVKCNSTLGQNITVDGLMKEGFKALFVALGAHKSKNLGIEGEDVEGVYSSMEFLKGFNVDNKQLAKGHVGVIGGGNSAMDAARVALRQEGVESLTIYYRRTRNEMPAIADEIEGALEEGIKIESLVSPVKVHTEAGKLTGVEFLKNELGEVDASGRRKPVPVPGSEFTVSLDTLLVAISEAPNTEELSSNLKTSSWGSIDADAETLMTNTPGVFAGGDVVTGPNTVVDAIATGKKAAVMIDRYLNGEDLHQPLPASRPTCYIEPIPLSEEELAKATRATESVIPMDRRQQSFDEVERGLSEKDALLEAKRCLRCDLNFLPTESIQTEKKAIKVKQA